MAKQQKKALKTIEVTANVAIGRNPTGGFGLAVELKIQLPDISREDARQIVQAAHQVCPYSNATRGNIEVKLTVVDKG